MHEDGTVSIQGSASPPRLVRAGSPQHVLVVCSFLSRVLQYQVRRLAYPSRLEFSDMGRLAQPGRGVTPLLTNIVHAITLYWQRLSCLARAGLARLTAPRLNVSRSPFTLDGRDLDSDCKRPSTVYRDLSPLRGKRGAPGQSRGPEATLC